MMEPLTAETYLALRVDKQSVLPNESFKLYGFLHYIVNPGEWNERDYPIVGATVNIYRNTIFLASRTTNDRGYYELVQTEGFEGSYEFYTNYAGDTYPADQSDPLTVIVRTTAIPTALSMEMDYETVAVGRKFWLTGYLTAEGKPLANMEVRLFVNGVDVRIVAMTSGIGYYEIPYITKETGTFNFYTYFAGKDLFDTATSPTGTGTVIAEFLVTHFVAHCTYSPTISKADPRLIQKMYEVEAQFEEEYKMDIEFVDIEIKQYPLINRTDIDFIFKIPGSGPIPLIALALIAIIVIAVTAIVVIAFLWWTTWIEKEKVYLCEQDDPIIEIHGWAAYKAHLEKAHPEKYGDIEAGIDNWWEFVEWMKYIPLLIVAAIAIPIVVPLITSLIQKPKR